METNEAVANKIVAHHQALVRGLEARVSELGASVRAGLPHHGPAKEVANYLAAEVFPHAEAEEATLYAEAGAKPQLSVLVRAMAEEHVQLRRGLSSLVGARDGLDAYGAATAILELLRGHVHRENESLLPHLIEDPGVDLAAILDGMHAELSGATDAAELAVRKHDVS